MTTRTWAQKKAERIAHTEPNLCRSVHVELVAKQLRYEHSRAVRIVKKEIDRVKKDQHTFTLGSKYAVLNELQYVLALVERGRT